MTTRRSYVLGAVMFLIAALAIFMTSSTGAAANEPCVPEDAWTEVIEHPAVTEIVHHEAVYKTEYHLAKHTQTKTRTKVPAVAEVWANFAPTNTKEPFIGPAIWPTDPRGKWNTHSKIPGGHAGPDGVYAMGDPAKGGNWFYRLNGKTASWGEWSAFGPWSKWSPESHSSWADSPDPIGEPAFHGQGMNGDTKWYRQWQIRHDGQTRETLIKEAYDEEIIVKEAWTETIEHPAVVCETPTPTPTTPVDEEQPTPTPTPDEEEEEEQESTPEPEIGEPTEEAAPEPQDDPVVQTETHHGPDKTVKVETHESGAVTRKVTHYPANMVEEGL